MHDRSSFLRRITPSITSIACTRVFLELSGTRPYAYGGRNRRNRSMRTVIVRGPVGTTAQSTSAGAYALTTLGNTTIGTDVGSIAEFTWNPSSAPSAQTV